MLPACRFLVAASLLLGSGAHAASLFDDLGGEPNLTRIVDGRINGFYKDVVLLEQPSVQEPKKTVKALLDAAGVTVRTFARFEVGQA